jgi:hypothetical protein
MTSAGFLFQWSNDEPPIRNLPMTNALTMNAMLVTLLTVASAVNGIIFYNFL